ncbi:unnamed protein product [Linum trigynum]|uniref:Bifunctional inhibitor/plant lipid transfer protein/seed storage helical domain-containing protein n=1 Tax=Linum trigynum TaxID=586398 RepID=A0AAV2DV69_9ROSI
MLLLAMVFLLCSGYASTVVSAAPSSGGGGSSSSEKEIEECAEQLAGLATCLPYVGGTAKSPTPDCCGGLKQLLNTNKKCLCVVIKDRDDPQLGLHINLTLAMSLPAVCNSASAANISKCPELLHLPPNSPDAQVFYQLGNKGSKGMTGPSPGPAPAGGDPNVVGAISGGDQGKQATSAGNKRAYDGFFWVLSLWELFFSGFLLVSFHGFGL